MSWIPAFEIGLWNAWILMLYFPLHPLIMLVVDRAVGTGGIFKKMGDVPYEKRESRAFAAAMIVVLLTLVYSVFLPLQLGTVWFYVGIAIYLVGLVLFVAAIVNIATTPQGQPFTKGLYRYSRHPMSVSGFIACVGVSIASASWLFFLLAIVVQALETPGTIAEERGCLATYGDRYREYLIRTPRWVGMPRSS